ncbi:MAG: lipopolysaccharide kinase InaA family protein [Myxococcota bacterium]
MRFVRSPAAGLVIRHRPELTARQVLAAIDAHRENAGRGREHCEHWGPASSVSRILLTSGSTAWDLAVKWNHPRGARAAFAERWRGSRAARAVAGARRLASLGIAHPETWAIAERRPWGRVEESFLLTGFLPGSLPLPAAMPELLRDASRRRRVADALGRALGRLHAADLDHGDLKHSNLLVTADDDIALLDLDSLDPPKAPTWRRRVRALGQLEAYTRDLYPELPRSDRARVLRAYFREDPRCAGRREALLSDVEAWVAERLRRWEGRDRQLHIYYPLAPRPALPPTRVDVSPGSEAAVTTEEGRRCASH